MLLTYLTSKISHHGVSVLVQQDVVTGRNTRSICNDNRYFKRHSPSPHVSLLVWHPPVEVPVNDGLGEVVQVLHALGHVDGNDELGLQVDQPVH